MFKFILAFFLFTGLAISWLIGYVFDVNFSTANTWGWSIWIVIFGLNIKHFLVITEANYGTILQNILLTIGKPATETKIIKVKNEKGIDIDWPIERPVGQRVVFAGINFKWPWETQVEEPISLTKATPLSGTVRRFASTTRNKNGRVEIVVKWIGAITPAQTDNLVMYYRTDEKSAEAIFKAEIDKKISDLISAKTGDEILDEKGGYFEIEVMRFYSGNALSGREAETARNIAPITIESVGVDQGTEKALSTAANASLIANAAKELLASAGTNPIAQAVVLAAGLGKDIPPGIIPIINPGSGKKSNKP